MTELTIKHVCKIEFGDQEVVIISSANSPTYQFNFFIGSKKLNFNKTINDLIDKSALNALEKNKKEKKYKFVSGYNIKEELIKLLLKKGYKEIKLKEYRLFDGIISDFNCAPEGMDEDLVEKIICYNKSKL